MLADSWRTPPTFRRILLNICLVFVFGFLTNVMAENTNPAGRSIEARHESPSVHDQQFRGYFESPAAFGFQPLKLASPNIGNRTHFMILMQSGRIGSTFIQKMLMRCPYIVASGEIFGRATYFRAHGEDGHFKARRAPAVTEWLHSLPTHSVRAGFKTVWDTVLDALPTIRDELKPSIIFLRRRNRVKKALSFEKAMTSGQWHAFHSVSLSPRTVDLNIFRFRLDQLEWADYNAERYIRQHFNGFPILTLDYEDYLDDPNVAISAIFEFLSVPGCSKMMGDTSIRAPKKTSPRRISDYVTNFNEVLDIVRGTEYEKMLTATDETDVHLYLPERLDTGMPFRKYIPKMHIESRWADLYPVSFKKMKDFGGKTYLDVEFPELEGVESREDQFDPNVFLEFDQR